MSVISENDLVLTIAGKQAGGKEGQLIVSDFTFNAERDNTLHHGIGNSEPVGITHGNETFTFEFTKELNEAAEDLIDDYFGDGTISASVETPNKTFDMGKLSWNDFSFEGSDGDGAPTLSATFDVHEFSTEDAAEALLD